MENKINKPIMKVRNGQLTATIWENKKKIDEREVMIQSVVLEKSYKVGEGDKAEWKSTNSFSKSDIPKAIAILQKVDQELNVKTE